MCYWGLMKGLNYLLASVIVAALPSVGAAQPISQSIPDRAAVGGVGYVDTALFWRECSGPNGERDASALPFYEAVFAHDPARIATLLDHGASPDVLLFPGGWSPLMVAVAYNDRPTMQVLVKHGANLNYVAKDPATGTALAVALTYGRFYPIGHPDFFMLHYLLDAGMDMDLDFRGKDIAQFAVSVGQIAIVNELLARGFRHDLMGLKKWLEIVHVNESTQPDKDKALATIERLLKH